MPRVPGSIPGAPPSWCHRGRVPRWEGWHSVWIGWENERNPAEVHKSNGPTWWVDNGSTRSLAFPPPHPCAKWVPRCLEQVLLEPGELSGLVLEVKGLQLSRPAPVLTTTLQNTYLFLPPQLPNFFYSMCFYLNFSNRPSFWNLVYNFLIYKGNTVLPHIFWSKSDHYLAFLTPPPSFPHEGEGDTFFFDGHTPQYYFINLLNIT